MKIALKHNGFIAEIEGMKVRGQTAYRVLFCPANRGFMAPAVVPLDWVAGVATAIKGTSGGQYGRKNPGSRAIHRQTTVCESTPE
jgi:hypothetical protein